MNEYVRTLCPLFKLLQSRAEKLSSQKEHIDKLRGYSKEELQSLESQMKEAYAEQLKQLTEMVICLTLCLEISATKAFM